MKLKLLILLTIAPVLVFGKPKDKFPKQIIMYNSPTIGEGMPTQLIITSGNQKPVTAPDTNNNPFVLKHLLKMSESNYKLIDSVISAYGHSKTANQGGSMKFLYKIKTTNADTHSSTFTLNAQNTRVLLITLIAAVRNHNDSQKIKEILEDEIKCVID